MEFFLKIVMVLVAVGLIITVLLQSGKSAGLSGAIAGGAEQIMGKQKARGIDAFLSKLTTSLAIGFMVLAILVSYVVG